MIDCPQAVVEHGSHGVQSAGTHPELAASIRSAAASTSRRSRLHWCHQLRFQDPPGSVSALVSFPGSGNTWVRYLIQQATGMLSYKL
jgi:hypothetical protein